MGAWDALLQKGAAGLVKVIFSFENARMSSHGKGKGQILI